MFFAREVIPVVELCTLVMVFIILMTFSCGPGANSPDDQTTLSMRETSPLTKRVEVSPPAQPTHLRHMSFKNNGQRIEIANGYILVVTLDANPTTGYTWGVAVVDESILRQIGEVKYRAENTRHVVGGGGVQTLRFQAVDTGKTELQLEYRRPWEAEQPAAETFSLLVVVK